MKENFPSANFRSTKFSTYQNFRWIKSFDGSKVSMDQKFSINKIPAFTWCIWLRNFRVWILLIMNVNIWVLIQISQISQMRIFKCDSVDCFNFVTVDWCYIFLWCSFFCSQKSKIRISAKNFRAKNYKIKISKIIFRYEFLKFMSCILFNVMTRVGSDQHNGIIDDWQPY